MLSPALAVLLAAALMAGCATRPSREPVAVAPPRAAPPSPDALGDHGRRRAADVVFTAMAFLDTPYRYGGNTAEQGFDCSGFTRHVFAQTLAVALPRRAEEQAASRVLRGVERDALVPGDLVFFNTLQRAYSHVGIYLGDGRFIHAPRSGSAVRVEDMRSSYWAARFDGARRALTIEAEGS
ncbi:MAG TPA: C40 family peptidase [Burkholderiaceae bacterium]|nr:C40 family peptidase [Burkholderiaceae bacterium]